MFNVREIYNTHIHIYCVQCLCTKQNAKFEEEKTSKKPKQAKSFEVT